MILVITSSFDQTADYIVSKLKKDFFRLNVDEFSKYKFIVNENGWTISMQNKKIMDMQVSSVYYRKPYLPNLDEYVPFYREMIREDIIYLIKGIVASLDCKKLTCPYVLQKAENKIFQMKIAQDVGFVMPITLLTNSQEDAKKMVVSSNNVIKPISMGKIFDNSRCEIYNTNLIHDNDFDIEKTPIFLQRYIRKDFEARVYFIKRKYFAVKIVAGNKVDWRIDEAKNKYESINIPNEIQQKCIFFMQKMDIEFGAFDFIIFKNEWYFLENNPNGQWLWLEQQLNLGIGDEIINYLEEKRNE